MSHQRAAQIARGQPHEHARPAGVRRLALDRMEDFVDRQHGLSHYSMSHGRARPAHRHQRLELSVRPRHVERHLLPALARPREGLRRAVVLRRALQHGRSEFHVLRPAQRRRSAAPGPIGRRPASSFRIKLYQKFTHPKMFKEALTKAAAGRTAADGATCSTRSRTPTSRTSTTFARGIDPLASSGKLGALLAQFPPSFKDSPPSRDYLAWLLEALHGLSASPSSSGTAAGATPSATRCRC